MEKYSIVSMLLENVMLRKMNVLLDVRVLEGEMPLRFTNEEAGVLDPSLVRKLNLEWDGSSHCGSGAEAGMRPL